MKRFSVLPQSKREWAALLLFPFKAWVLIAFPFYVVFSSYVSSQHVRYALGALGQTMIDGYILSIAALLFGALVQSIVCKRGTATRTALYAIASIILIFTLYHF